MNRQDIFRASNFDFKTMFSFSDISDKTKTHLTKVYGTIMLCCLVSALGAFVNQTFVIGGFFLNILSLILSIYLIV